MPEGRFFSPWPSGAAEDMYHHVRHVRLADGPDIVHLNTIAREE